MNEIEKLYENAGLTGMWVEEYDDKQFWYGCYTEMIQSMMKLNDWDRKTATSVAHKECRKAVPPFTAEKQLNLIKWLVRNQDILKITYHREFLWCSGVEWVESDCYEEFEESLADLLNYLWQDLTNEEKEQIRSVLNG